MTSDDEKFQEAIERIDESNREDPNQETFAGKEYPKELLYSQRMTQWLDRLAPDAPDALRLAARAQHICRWQRPRGDYPMDRTGYLKWRTDLYQFHADRAAEILCSVGYGEDTVARVQFLLKKKRLKADPDTQMLEDVICLVFLEDYFADFAKQHDEEKIVNILQKTWKKMSPRGHEAALTLEIPPGARELVAKALAE